MCLDFYCAVFNSFSLLLSTDFLIFPFILRFAAHLRGKLVYLVVLQSTVDEHREEIEVMDSAR